MKLARPILAAVAVGVVLAVVFVVFAVELASGQSRSRNEIRTEVDDRAVLAASLINSLFGTVQQSDQQYTAEYGTTVNLAKLNAAAQQNRYAVVTDSDGTVIAATSGFDPRHGLGVPAAALQRIAAQRPAYYLGDLVRDGQGYSLDLIAPFPAPGGERLLITGLDPTTLVAFFKTELRNIPGVRGEVNYLIDGHDAVVAASDPSSQVGVSPALPTTAALARLSGEDKGLYFQAAPLSDSGWRILLVAPEATLFSSVDGSREYVPWIIYAALVVVAIVAALLGWRVIRTAEVVGEVNSRLASVNDELSVANEALHRRAAELARSNEELDSFASIASHDLQEPLRKVRTFTEQLTVIDGDHLSDKGRDYLGRANQAAERMQRLIEDLLKFSRVSTQGRPFERVDLAAVANRVLDDLEAQIDDAGARIDIDPLPVITADPLQMQQLLQNLVSNALKFRQPDVAPWVRVSAETDSGLLHLAVTDNGIGFEPRYAARIFRIFERLHGRTEYPGTGIGLALCRKIADRHGGTIEATGEPGQGATFLVILPIDQPEGSFGFGLPSRDTPASEEVAARAGV